MTKWADQALCPELGWLDRDDWGQARRCHRGDADRMEGRGQHHDLVRATCRAGFSGTSSNHTWDWGKHL